MRERRGEERTERTGSPFDRRAVSDVVGYVLVFSLVVAVVGIVSLTGFSSLEDARYAEQTNNAERAFDVLSDNVADVYGDGAPSRGTEMSLSEATLSTAGDVTVNVTARDADVTGDRYTLEKKLQPVVWTGTRETEIVYALGATLRNERSGGRVIEAGPSQYDPDRTVIHIVQTRGPSKQFSGTTVRVRAVHSTSNVLLAERSNEHDVWLNITSPRADIWKDHLDRYPGTDCGVVTLPGQTTETVRCEFSDRDSVFIMLSRIDVEIEE